MDSLKNIVDTSLSPEKGEDIMSTAEKLFNEGLQQGVQQGIRQGVQQGIQQGVQQGIQQGVQQGLYQGLLDAIDMGLSLKYGAKGLKLLPEIAKIKDIAKLKAIKEAIKIAKNISEIEVVME